MMKLCLKRMALTLSLALYASVVAFEQIYTPTPEN